MIAVEPHIHTTARRLRRASARVLMAIALVGAGGALAPAGAPAITIGVADQDSALFTNSSFVRTRLGHARIFVAWDAILDPGQRQQLDAWFLAAHAAGVTPLVTFARSRTSLDHIPTTPEFGAMIHAFRARYPWVREFSTWNEANSCGARTCRHEQLVAAWWRQIRLACPGCTVLAADLLDSPNIASWVKSFRHYASTPPKVWGLHNYIDVNRYSTTYTREALKAIGSAKLWLTETGGIVARHNHSTIKLPQGYQHAANATTFLFTRIRRLSSRIQRIYFYDWIADPPPTTWDSAIVSSRLAERRAYRVLRQWLGTLASAGELTGRLPAHR